MADEQQWNESGWIVIVTAQVAEADARLAGLADAELSRIFASACANRTEAEADAVRRFAAERTARALGDSLVEIDPDSIRVGWVEPAKPRLNTGLYL